MIRRVLVGALALLFAASGTTLATGGPKLHPSGFGEHSYSSWKAGEGLPDSTGDKDQALYFQKMTETFAFAAGVAVIRGLEGTDVSALTAGGSGLEWQHRDDGWCGAGAPRWNVNITASDGKRYTVFLGCAAAAHSPGDGPDWIRDTYPGPAIAAQIQGQVFATAFNECIAGGLDAATCTAAGNAAVTAALAGELRNLVIVFDEGTTLAGAPYGLGFVYLDNLIVDLGATVHEWTCAADNGQDPTSSGVSSTLSIETLLDGDSLLEAIGLPQV